MTTDDVDHALDEARLNAILAQLLDWVDRAARAGDPDAQEYLANPPNLDTRWRLARKFQAELGVGGSE